MLKKGLQQGALSYVRETKCGKVIVDDSGCAVRNRSRGGSGVVVVRHHNEMGGTVKMDNPIRLVIEEILKSAGEKKPEPVKPEDEKALMKIFVGYGVFGAGAGFVVCTLYILLVFDSKLDSFMDILVLDAMGALAMMLGYSLMGGNW